MNAEGGAEEWRARSAGNPEEETEVSPHQDVLSSSAVSALGSAPLPRLSAPPLLVAGLEDQLTASQRLPTGRGNDGGGCGPRRTPVVHRHVSGDRGCRGARRSRPGAHEPFRYLGDRPVLPELRAQVRGLMPGQRGEDDGLLHSTCLFCVCVNVFMCDQ